MSAPTRNPRGFTLLELMVAGAVGVIIVTAALAAFDLQSQFARNTERLLSAQASAGLGLTMMQRDLENAGLRFRGGGQADGGVIFGGVVRPYDSLGTSITTLKNDPGGATTVVAAAGSNPGFIPGTDAFEVLQGGTLAFTQRMGAQVSSVAPGVPSQKSVKISPNPFVVSEFNTQPLLMFWKDDVHCLGRVVGAITLDPLTGSAIAVVNTVDIDLGLAATPFQLGCPQQLQNVEVVEHRRRYLIYRTQDLAGRPARIGLHLQQNATCDPIGAGTPCDTNLLPPQMVSEGVDDMQISWRVPDAYSPVTFGWCQNAPGDPTCGFDQAVPNATTQQRMAAIYGAHIYLASRGQEVLLRPNEPVPALLNHVPAPATDGLVRAIMQTSVLFRNSVTP